MQADERITRPRLTTPRAAAIAGILFSVLLTTALVLIRRSIPSDHDPSWLTEPGKRTSVTIAANLVPFAGIAFLWFIGVIRDRIGEHEDRFFATVFLGSGLLFIAMLFVACADAGGLIRAATQFAALTQDDAWRISARTSSLLLNVYAMRMAAVFTLSVATIGLRTQVLPRWLAFAGYASAVVLLVSSGISSWVQLLFPLWILVLSIHILARPWTPETTNGDPS